MRGGGIGRGRWGEREGESKGRQDLAVSHLGALAFLPAEQHGHCPWQRPRLPQRGREGRKGRSDTLSHPSLRGGGGGDPLHPFPLASSHGSPLNRVILETFPLHRPIKMLLFRKLTHILV